ncbi:MAG: CmcJ/NvfI family oxidoreductase [Gammaproteobacteria bacterium]|nr:CmcJ/NvfI family oxidoreductase [Gammaproteobacteria bacterium]
MTGSMHVTGTFNYLDESIESSLYRNGKVYLRRDTDGNDRGMHGLKNVKKSMPVCNARNRQADERPTLHGMGFELLHEPLAEPDLDFFAHDQVVRHYYPHCESIIAAATGARAFAFDHNLRSAPAKQEQQRIVGGQHVQEPLQLVHGDYTLTSAPQRLRDLTRPPGRNDTLRGVLGADESLLSAEQAQHALAEGGRFAIINLWRNIATEPVQSKPLALCDSRSVDPQDLVVFEIHYEDRIGENYFAKHAASHRWFYYPEMSRDEALLIKQWDSSGPLAQSEGRLSDASDMSAVSTFSYHSAFEDPGTPPDAPDRQSIEVRCIVIYE